MPRQKEFNDLIQIAVYVEKSDAEYIKKNNLRPSVLFRGLIKSIRTDEVKKDGEL